MTFTLGTHFDELLKNIQPPQERLDAAKDLPDRVRTYLKDHEEFLTRAPHSRLVGSYAQHLSVTDVKDVDFLVRVDGDPEANEPEAKKLIQALRNALDGLPDALGYEGYAGVDIERARRSIHVYIKGRDFHLDVVPCIAPDGFESPIWIPDRGFNQWIKSHPLGFVNLLEELTAEHGSKVRSLGKLFKHWRDVQMTARKPKSYWLGAVLVDHVQNTLDMTKPLAELVHDLFDQTYTKFQPVLNLDGRTPNIPDPLLGHNVSWNWERAHFETFMRRLDEGRDRARKALDAKTREDAVSHWRRLFGEEFFPADVEEAAKAAAAVGYPGSARVTSAGLVVPGTMTSGSVPVPTTKYHGAG